MMHSLLRRLVRTFPLPTAERYARGEADIAELIETLDLRLTELQREVEASESGRPREGLEPAVAY